MEYIQIALAACALLGVIIVLIKLQSTSNSKNPIDKNELDRQLAGLRTELNSSIQTSITNLKQSWIPLKQTA